MLAITGLLNEFPTRIEKMGLSRADDGWVVAKKLTDTAAFALLFLYRVDTRFEPAILQVLEGASFYSAIQILANLKSTDRLSKNIQQALWKRALRENGPASSDRAALEAVALTWPEMLMEDSTLVETSRWSASARRAYLAALRKIDQRYADDVARTACQFLSDGEQSIRRDAARLANDRDPAVLKQAVHQLAANHEKLDQAVFMLDAAFWLETDWNLFETIGKSHREPLVRELARKLGEARKKSMLAREYLPTVLDSRDYLDTWRYGQALLELGNEETIDRLYRGLPSEVYRRAYLIWLAKELEQRLEKRRPDQADMVKLPPPISGEKPVEVTVELEGDRLGPFAGILQLSQARRPRRWLWSWSIRIEDEPDLAVRLNTVSADDSIYIETTDGHRGQVFPVRTDIHTKKRQTVTHVVLLGQGELIET